MKQPQSKNNNNLITFNHLGRLLQQLEKMEVNSQCAQQNLYTCHAQLSRLRLDNTIKKARATRRLKRFIEDYTAQEQLITSAINQVEEKLIASYLN